MSDQADVAPNGLPGQAGQSADTWPPLWTVIRDLLRNSDNGAPGMTQHATENRAERHTARVVMTPDTHNQAERMLGLLGQHVCHGPAEQCVLDLHGRMKGLQTGHGLRKQAAAFPHGRPLVQHTRERGTPHVYDMELRTAVCGHFESMVEGGCGGTASEPGHIRSNDEERLVTVIGGFGHDCNRAQRVGHDSQGAGPWAEEPSASIGPQRVEHQSGRGTGLFAKERNRCIHGRQRGDLQLGMPGLHEGGGVLEGHFRGVRGSLA